MELPQLAAFTLVTALLVMSPGPNGVLIARTVPVSGRAAGFANIAGFVAAFYVHGALSILGLSLLLVKSAEAFLAVKLAGAAYLIWIGLKALHDAWKSGGPLPAQVTPARRRRTLATAFTEGFLTNALNPKVAMFYLAAFPQFMPAGTETALPAFGLVTIHAALNVTWFSALVLLTARLAGAARSPRFARALKAATGLVFIGFGLKLASVRAAQ